MTIRRLSRPLPDHQVVFSEVMGKAYPKGTAGDYTLDATAAVEILRNPAVAQTMLNLGGVLNTGEIYNDTTHVPVLVPMGDPPPDVYPWPEGYSLNPDALPHGQPNNLDVNWKPGIVEWYQTTRPGRASCSVHGGGNPMFCGVSDTLRVLRPEPLTTWGQGGTAHIETPAGWFVMMWCVTDATRPGFYNFQEPA